MAWVKSAEFARIAGVSRAAITKRCKAGSLVRTPAGKLDTENQVNKAFLDNQRGKGVLPKPNLVSSKETKAAKESISSQKPPTSYPGVGIKSEIIKNIKNIGRGERYTFFSDGTLSFIDILKTLISDQDNTKIMLATWQLGVKNIEELKKINKKHELKILLDVSFQNRCVSAFEDIKLSLGDIIWFSKNHTKVLTVGKGDRKFTVLSSANFNKNIRFEFFDITEGAELYNSTNAVFAQFFQDPPIGKDKRTRQEISKEFNDNFSSQSQRVIQAEQESEKPIIERIEGEDVKFLESILSGETIIDSLDHLSKTSIDRVKVIDQIKKLRMDMDVAQNKLISRDLVSRVFSKLYAIDINEFKTLGPAISQDIVPIIGSIEEKKVMEINNMVDGHLRKVLQHIKRVTDDFLKTIEIEGV